MITLARYQSKHSKSGGYHSKKYIKNNRSDDDVKYIPSEEPQEYIQKPEPVFIDDDEDIYENEIDNDEYEASRRTKPMIVIIIILLILTVFGAGAYAVYNFVLKPPAPQIETVPTATMAPATKQEATKQEATKQEATTEPTESEEEKLEKAAREYVSGMSKDEKIYQMFIVRPETITGVDVATQAGDATKEALSKYPVGGIVMFSQNIEDKDQIKEMISNMQSYSKIPLFISVDEEGGAVSRVQEKLSTTELKDMYEYKDDGEDTAKKNAKTLADSIKALGFNYDFAPVADVWTNKDSDAIGERCYTDDYETATKLIPAAVEGFHQGNIITSLKHFPGLGGASEDTHDTLAHTSKSKNELLNEDLAPFKAGIAAGADSVMTAHIIVDELDSEKPATISKSVVPELLRKELDYKGIVITDSLQMSSITESYSTDELVVGMINDATVDIILDVNSIDDYYEAINKALTDGDIKETSIDESVVKIIALKMKYGIIKTDTKTTSQSKPAETKATIPTETN